VEVEGQRKPWYRKFRYILILSVLAVLLVASFVPYLYHAPVERNQQRLNLTVDYIVNTYNPTIGLVRETPGSSNYWLYSDNYLVVLALQRYDPSNSTTAASALGLDSALTSYMSTMPSNLGENQYQALNSSAAWFSCSENATLSWTGGHNSTGGSVGAHLYTVANDRAPSCATQNYADLLLLQALHYHRVGNSSGAMYFYDKASTDFNGVGFVDLVSSSKLYDTYKVALYVYTASCLGQTSGSSFGTAVSILYSMQDNSTGGFFTGYTGLSHSSGTVNTETTALASLALEQVIKPSATC
jgi:hypothetical protein